MCVRLPWGERSFQDYASFARFHTSKNRNIKSLQLQIHQQRHSFERRTLTAMPVVPLSPRAERSNVYISSFDKDKLRQFFIVTR